MSYWTFILFGLLIIILTMLKPRFYWESRKAVRLRKLIGDFGTSLLYIAIGAILVGYGVYDLIL